MYDDSVDKFSASLRRISSFIAKHPDKKNSLRELDLLKNNIKHIISTLKPSIENENFEISGSELPTFYHAGQKLLKTLKTRFLKVGMDGDSMQHLIRNM